MLALPFKVTKQVAPKFQNRFTIHDHEKKALEYGLHFRPNCGYTEQILWACRCLGSKKAFRVELPFALNREERLYLEGKISDLTEQTGFRFKINLERSTLTVKRSN